MNLLLPHRYKKIGAWIAPSGIALWLAMQLGYTTKILKAAFDTPGFVTAQPPYHLVNVCLAVLGFFGFLAGLYFLAFSKEKKEDEMVQKTRLDSFQFAALVQIVFVITGFCAMLILGDPKEGGFMLFFIVVIMLFWLCFIGRFNYMLHVKFRR